jgi:dTDP-4-dehydrorhamnose reductase
MTRPELWVGPECTVNRVGDTYGDQLEATGFTRRLDDLDRLASLGATCVRFPLLWERTERANGEHDFGWADTRLARLRELGLAPIAGLVHHGSGPRNTGLLDPQFPARLAAFAAAAALRYPWVDTWTPVNEPLTTARFAALYGHWHPHARSDAAFVRALLQQVHGTVQAMRAVRSVNPHARLVQTDDVGHTSGTPEVQDQVEFDNLRRWLTFDLLCGHVGPEHALWKYLIASGAQEDELRRLRDEPMPPDVVGINFYVTSERFLDHRTWRYPPHLRGGNGRTAYVDLEAVRVLGAPMGGFEARLREAAQRYDLPLAITEAHLGCTREEQLRWFAEAWSAAQKLVDDRVAVRAVTAWSAFGAVDWDSLLTQRRGRYEPGLWDVRGPVPRPTALAALVRQLGAGERPSHPVLASPGWWRREVRHEHPAHGPVHASGASGPPLLIAGARGTLGQAFARACVVRGLPYRLLSREELDLCDRRSVREALRRWQPWAVVNAAGYVRVDDAETDARQWRDNALGPIVLGRACARAGIPSLSFSSDLVFDGASSRPYRESDTPNPLNAYGRAKLRAERVLLRLPGALVIRTAAFFGPWDRWNFLTLGLARLERGEPWPAVADQLVSPTYVPDLVHASLDLLVDGEQRLWHVANLGAFSWWRFACLAAEAARLPTALIRPVNGASLGLPACRPRYSALRSERGDLADPLEAALERYVAQTPWRRQAELAPAAFGAAAA